MSEQDIDRKNEEPIIKCRDVHKWFGDFEALKGISMDVYTQEVIVIFGPSGSGKSTFIRTINRLEEHQQGDIIVDGMELTHDVRNIERIRMETGMVFQLFNLFPHLTVLQNITLAPMHVRKWPKNKAEEIAASCWRVWVFLNRLRSIRVNCPAGSNSVSRLRVRWRCSRRSCCSMSRHRL